LRSGSLEIHKTGERLTQLEDQKNRSRCRERKNAKSADGGRVIVSEKAEAREFDGKSEN
jgi:hypothetical protein